LISHLNLFAIAQGLAKEGAAGIVNGRTMKRFGDAGVSGRLEGLAADLGTAGPGKGTGL
jgi:hypothetical protein